jgi:hypothetical protein
MPPITSYKRHFALLEETLAENGTIVFGIDVPCILYATFNIVSVLPQF